MLLTSLRDSRDGAIVDRGLVTRFDEGLSYTGEQMFEFSGHGGIAAPAAGLTAILRAGARHARPGEFTQRAFLNKKIDLLQAEAIADLVDARTDALRAIAVTQLGGGLSDFVGRLRQNLLELEALIAYELDFPEEDDGPIPASRIQTAVDDALGNMRVLLGTTERSEIARIGATVVIAGPPNAGKSSLFNALLGENRAIVTEHPGTTRDAIEAVIDDRAIPLRLVDNAGLRETSDPIERRGIEVSERHLAGAHVVLACADCPGDLEPTIDMIRSAGTSGAIIGVVTKSDKRATSVDTGDALHVSAITQAGLGELLSAVRACVRVRLGADDPSVPALTRARQGIALTRAHDELTGFSEEWNSGKLPVVVAAVRVRAAIHALEELVGAIDPESVLGAVFERFCVGK